MEKQKKAVLVLEDEQPLLDVIKIKLEKEGYDAVPARSVQQALDHLKNMPKISAFWIDHYLLGKEDAYSFVKEMKSEGGAWAKLPMIVVSNTVSDDKIRAYLDLGVNKYYIKAQHTLDEIIGDLKKCIDDLASCPIGVSDN